MAIVSFDKFLILQASKKLYSRECFKQLRSLPLSLDYNSQEYQLKQKKTT